ncbi:lytic transglycosylase domain-containing protein (plasmid) [Amycolatopsis sp. FU40]|uniref:lytic transglycosylase domain-containing protein n=1 Tax=Amycolatopsis sp. FU40 TaxID=2914159 RepID=UPI001F29DE9F|nr:lytic transglycosylase domain-containing protein [Amycolatopsis sp. FU40]UKD50812.1 lytic transglycosylase domain-containing protein [Amycolatopsis sp. FU40]
MSFAKKVLWGAAILGGIVWIDHHGDGLVASADTDNSPIPAAYKAHYDAAAGTCPHLDAALLAAVGKIETDHGRARMPGVHSGANSAGAAGPMQFLPATFQTMRKRHPDIGPDQYDPETAIKAAAHYLCDSGVAKGDVRGALFAYNHSDKYVADVQAQARAYR